VGEKTNILNYKDKPDGYIDPNGSVTRAEGLAALQRFGGITAASLSSLAVA